MPAYKYCLFKQLHIYESALCGPNAVFLGVKVGDGLHIVVATALSEIDPHLAGIISSF
jgi:hypothetical protein